MLFKLCVIHISELWRQKRVNIRGITPAGLINQSCCIWICWWRWVVVIKWGFTHFKYDMNLAAGSFQFQKISTKQQLFQGEMQSWCQKGAKLHGGLWFVCLFVCLKRQILYHTKNISEICFLNFKYLYLLTPICELSIPPRNISGSATGAWTPHHWTQLRKPGRLSPWCHECVAGEIQHRQLVGAAARVSSASVQVKAHSRDREQRPEVTAELIRCRRRRSLCCVRKPLSRSRLWIVILLSLLFQVGFQWKYDIFGASPPWIERGCSLRATERRGSERISRFSFFSVFLFWPSRGRTLLRTAMRWGNCEVDPAPTSDISFLRLLPAVAKVSVGSCAGILSSAILFSPRFLLPGQMHTNAFRSSTDKEWTRFRGSNVRQHFVIYVHFFFCRIDW